MGKTLYILLLFVYVIVIFGCSGDYYDLEQQKKGNDYTAWIDIESCDSGLKVLAFCRNNTTQDAILRYELKAKKAGPSGTADTFQAGSFNIASRQEKCLSELGLSASSDDHYRIELKVYKDEKLVAEDFTAYSKQF